MLRRRHLDAAWRRVLSREPIVLEAWSGVDIAKELGL
jgi:hypothetical protein